jgi:hypothetical protein
VNAAILHNGLVNIEEIRIRLEEQGFERVDVKAKLEADYRSFAKKKAFHCLCCDSPVEMVLPFDRNFYFRHWDKSECSYSENYKKYEKKISTYEEPTKHILGKTIIRTILEGQSKPLGLTVEPGYLYRTILSIVPDFIIKHPNGEVWAIDYLTGIRTNTAYSKNVEKRKEIYEQNNFKAHFFIDDEWLAYKSGLPYTTFVQTEIDSSVITSEDLDWHDYIKALPLELIKVLVGDTVLHDYPKSITYINPTKREATILRYLLLDSNNARLLAEPIYISLENALSIDPEHMEFNLFGENENLERMDTTEKLYKELDEIKLNEEKERILMKQLEEQQKKNTSEALIDDHLIEYSNDRGSIFNETYEETEKRVIAKWGNPKRNHQDVSPTPEGIWNLSAYLNSLPANVEESTEYKRKRKKESELIERIVNHSITGETYILGGTRAWKETILSELGNISNGAIGIIDLIKLLKERGFTFTQPEKHIEYPIREFVGHVSKILKEPLILK